MHILLSLIRATVSAHSSSLISFFIASTIMAIVGRFSGTGSFGTVVIAAIAAFLPVTLFAQDERMGLDILWGTLPVTRRQVVISRYLLIAAILILMIMAGLAFTYLFPAGQAEASKELLSISPLALAGTLFSFTAILISLQMPLFFALGYARTGMYATGALFLFFCLIGLVGAQFPGFRISLYEFLASDSAFPVGILIGIALFSVSAAISIALYSRRDFT